MRSIETRLSTVERKQAKLQTVTVHYIGREKGSRQMDLLQALQLLLARKIYRVEVEMNDLEMRATLDETTLMIEDYLKERENEKTNV